ncbi:MAG: glyoxylate/hydroxypyruvate reductase A [Pseudomonadota bacterium]|nr:glyoxylate/hydroxypyruvate reductase A [Pseudomonadota bacterium]
MKTLLLVDPIPAAPFIEAVRAIAPDVEMLAFRADLSEAELASVEAVLAWRIPPDLAGRLPRLRWVCSVAAGVEKLLVPGLPAEVPVSRIVDTEQAEGIAQFVVMMALRHARDLPTYEAQQRERAWRRQPVTTARHRVAVLGTGTMGGAIARLMSAVGFSVTGWSRSVGGPLETLLAASDLLVCALPLTPQTEGILNARRLALLPRGAYVINIARGAHVVEPDLIAAVRSGQLAGAALDVQCNEPMASDDPLWSVPGITITPHIAAQSHPATIAAQFVAGLRQVAQGAPPPQLVDRERGY